MGLTLSYLTLSLTRLVGSRGQRQPVPPPAQFTGSFNHSFSSSFDRRRQV